MKSACLLVSTLLVSLGAMSNAGAAEPTTIKVVIKDHQFIPSEIHVPSGQEVILFVTNSDATPEEFDSSALKVEKVITGGATGMVRLRRLAPGRFPFMGEYHEDTAKGVVIAE
jgi:plastocyanin